MKPKRTFYIASCYFTAHFPELSLKAQEYARSCGIPVLRCCIPNYRVTKNTERIPNEQVRAKWSELPVSEVFDQDDLIYSACPNCLNIVEEWRGARALSLWELIDSDPDFRFPDYNGMTVTLQDCWRTRDREGEMAAVRSLLTKMNVKYVEAEKHHGETDFCGCTLYRPQLPKNEKLAPKHYVQEAQGKFLPHTPEEQAAIMRDYCNTLPTKKVVTYCHYCLEGLLLGGADATHLAAMLFGE